MTDISEIKISIDKANREMYEAFVGGNQEVALKQSIVIERLALTARWAIEMAKLEQMTNDHA